MMKRTATTLALLTASSVFTDCQCPPDCQVPCTAVWVKPQNDIGLTTSADFLYWQANADGIAYGTIANYFANISAPPSSAGQSFSGNNLFLDFKFDPGARVIVGVRPRHDQWQLDATWTFLYSHATGASNNPNEILGPIVNPSYGVPTALANNGINAKASWWSHYNTIDLDMNKGLAFGRCFGLKAHLGLRNLWLNQRYNIYSLNEYNTSPTVFADGWVNMEQKIWGLGPLVGLDSIWKAYRWFSVIGKASCSLLWSHVHSTYRGYFGYDRTQLSNALTTIHTTLPEIGLMIGAQFDTNLCGSYHFMANLGWEFHSVFNMNYFGTYLSAGQFNMRGLTAGLGFDY